MSATVGADQGGVPLLLTCTGPHGCGHTFAPDRHALAAGQLACPRCDGWNFQAALAEPTTVGGGRR